MNVVTVSIFPDFMEDWGQVCFFQLLEIGIRGANG